MSYNADDVAISVSNVTKAYKIFETPGQRFLYHMFHTKSGRDFVALDNVSFEVKKGESFGIIGRNGSGKSTMLQILAGILKATSGEIKVNGRIAALLELGSGFNPESTGYENIYMNAAILGVSKDEIDKKVDEIIAFADIGDFVNQPVKTYSSGMFVRLAFAVAINVDADILLIDEALAVGDLFFRQKCYAKLNQLKEEGKTIILVTHAMGEVEQFCDRAILLHKSRPIMEGRSPEVVKKYYLINQGSSVLENEEAQEEGREKHIKDSFSNGWKITEEMFFDLGESKEFGTGQAVLKRIGLFDEQGKGKRVFRQGETAYLYYEFSVLDNLHSPICGFLLYDNRNTIVHGKEIMQYADADVPRMAKAGDTIKILQIIQLDVACSDYSVDVGLTNIPYKYFEQRSMLMQEELDQVNKKVCIRTQAGFFSVIPREIGAPTQITFHGHADLQGSAEIILEEPNV